MSAQSATAGRFVVLVSGEPGDEPGDEPGATWFHRRVRFSSRSRARRFARERESQGFRAIVRRHRRGLPVGWLMLISYTAVSFRVREPAIGLDEEIHATATRSRATEVR